MGRQFEMPIIYKGGPHSGFGLGINIKKSHLLYDRLISSKSSWSFRKKFFESSISLYNYFSCSYPPLSLPPPPSLSLSLSLPRFFYISLSLSVSVPLSHFHSLSFLLLINSITLSLSPLSPHFCQPLTLSASFCHSISLLFLYALSSSLSPTSHSSPTSFPLFISILRFFSCLTLPKFISLFRTPSLPRLSSFSLYCSLILSPLSLALFLPRYLSLYLADTLYSSFPLSIYLNNISL